MTPRKKKDKATVTGAMTAAQDVTAEVVLDPHNPIPLELENVFGFSPGGNKFIPFFAGTDCFYGFNNFFVNILQARTQSTTQNSCIISKTNYTLGDGVYIANLKQGQQPDPQWQAFVKRANPKETFNKVLRKVIDQYYTFGNCPIEIVKGVVAGKKFLHVYVKNQLDCRKSWPDENNESNAMVISRFFRKKGVYNLTEKFNIRIPFYESGPGLKKLCWLSDTEAKGGTDGAISTGMAPTGGIPVQRTAIWISNEYAGYDHYGLPSWLPSKIFGMIEFDAAHNNLDNMNNNMSPGGLLTLQGSLSDAEVLRQAKIINKRYTGKGKIGRTMVIGSEESIENSKYTPLSTIKDGNYVTLDDKAESKIIQSNEWDQAFLGGHDGASKAKSGSYLNELYQQKIKTVIKPLHRKIKDEFFDPLCEIADEWLGTNWRTYDIDIQCSNLFDDTTEASTTVNGLNALYALIDKVSSGALPVPNAMAIAKLRFGMTYEECTEIFNGIIVQAEPKITTTITE